MENSDLVAKKKNKAYYDAKANDSFRTKMNMYLFHKVLTNTSDSLDLDEFVSFEITKALVVLYTTVYWQMEANHIIEQCGLTCDEIYKKITQLSKAYPEKIEEYRKDYIANRFPGIFKKEDFEKLLDQIHCNYCGITKEEIDELAVKRQLRKKNLRGWTLEIDRLDSNIEYRLDNCVMSCYWCNNAKTDEFTLDEFMEVGKVIRSIWDKRLSSV